MRVFYSKRAASVTLEIGLGQNCKKKVLVLGGTVLLTVLNYWECKKGRTAATKTMTLNSVLGGDLYSFFA